MTGVIETSSISPRGKPVSPQSFPSNFPATRTTTLTCFDFSSFLSRREHHFQNSSTFMLFVFFMSLCFFSLSFLCLWMFGCVLGLCVFLRVCVFSPAASIDYGSFADRCSTWLELLRLKAHTIRRGSVKTSRRTHSLAHSGDHTYRFTVPEHVLTCTHTPLHACHWGRSIVSRAIKHWLFWLSVKVEAPPFRIHHFFRIGRCSGPVMTK